jgi:hypothetical protein
VVSRGGGAALCIKVIWLTVMYSGRSFHDLGLEVERVGRHVSMFKRQNDNGE